MKTRVLKILASTKWLSLLLLLALPAVAEAQYYYTNGLDIWSYTPNNGPVTITGYSYSGGYVYGGGMVTIPDTINGHPVTNIGEYAFSHISGVGSVIIPDSVTSIGEQAFESCYDLTRVYFFGNSPTPTNDLTVFSFDNSVTVYYLPGTTGWGTAFDGLQAALLNPADNFNYDYNYTFVNNVLTTTITLTGYIGPAGLMIIPSTINGYPVTSTGLFAFENSSSVTGVTIFGTNLTSIGDDTFYDCYNVTSVTLPDSVTNIGGGAFSYCNRLASVNIPDNVTSIGGQAFFGCSLTSVTISDSVTNIGDGAFTSCFDLTNISVAASNPDYSSLDGVLFDKNQTTLIDYPGGLFGAYTFGAYTIPDSVTNIAYLAFAFSYLTNVTIPDSVTSISDWAFTECNYLPSVTIPESVTSIGDFAIGDCSSLTNISVAASNPDFSSLDGVLFDKAQATLLQCPSGLNGSYTIPASVTSIGEKAFEYCDNLASVIIPASVTNIEESAFDSCFSLTGIYFEGNSPTPTNDTSVFSRDSHGIVYYLPDATGWGTNFDGLSTALWLPQMQTGNSNFGIQSNQFGFGISWAGNEVVVVEAATNLVNPVWIPIATNTLVNGTSTFSDPQWTNYPGRYYRLSSQ